MRISQKNSVTVLSQNKYFAPLIKKHGLPAIKSEKNVFQSLVRSVIYQQISGKAAATIFQRFCDLYKNSLFPEPHQVLKTSDARLRKAGLSSQKISYIKNLARKFKDENISYATFQKMTSDEIIYSLTKVKGIGIWTVHMFLIFTLKRLDILPTGDLAIKKGFQIVYNLRKMPDHKKMEYLAKSWRSHASVASWYLWRVSDDSITARK